MEFPISVLQGLNYKASKPQAESVREKNDNWNTDQINKSEEPCPVGCNPDKTTVVLAKASRKDKGRFVRVFYRESKLKPEETLEDKQKRFWAEVNKIETRSTTNSKSIVL